MYVFKRVSVSKLNHLEGKFIQLQCLTHPSNLVLPPKELCNALALCVGENFTQCKQV